VLARFLVLVFAVLVIGAGAAIGYIVLGDSTPLLGNIADPTSAIDPEDTTRW